MAPALIEAAGVASRDRQSSSCNKTPQPYLLGKRIFELKKQKYLLREAKVSAEPTWLTDASPRVDHSANLNCNTSVDPSTVSDNCERTDNLSIVAPISLSISVADISYDTGRSNCTDFAMHRPDNGRTSCVADDETKLDRNHMAMSSSQLNSSGTEMTEISAERHSVAVDKVTLTNLKRRKRRHHKKLKEFEQRVSDLNTRIRALQAHRIACHVKNQIDVLNESSSTSTSRSSSGKSSLTASSLSGTSERKVCSKVVESKNSESQEHYGREQLLSKENLYVKTSSIISHQSVLCTSLCDPDATESETEDDDIHETSQVSNKAYTTWLRDRTQIGSRCSWLESQMSDLDQKIKKYEEMTRISLAKKADLFGSHTTRSMEAFSTSSRDAQGAQKMKLSEPGHKNGMFKSLQQSTSLELKDNTVVCARSLPLQNRSAHRYLCIGQVPIGKTNYLGYNCPAKETVLPCQLCQKACSADNKMKSGNARAAALDHSYHTKLSFGHDVLLPTHLEVALRQGGLDTTVKPVNSKILSRKREQEKKRSSNRAALNSLVAAAKAAKIKLSGHGLSQSLPTKLTNRDIQSNKKKSAAVSAASQMERRARKLNAPRENSTRIGNSVTESSLSQSQPTSTLSNLIKKKRPSSAFDINNIVIPYSIACSTRVEKLQYKEIPTPGWRQIECEPPLKSFKLEVNQDYEMDEEDTSEDAYAHRHVACELEERKRFSVFFQPIRRSRSLRRSSECNTPEPHSPASNDESRSNTPAASTPTEPSQTWLAATGSSGTRSLLWTQLKPDDNTVPPWPSRCFPLSDDEVLNLNATCSPSPSPDRDSVADSGKPDSPQEEETSVQDVSNDDVASTNSTLNELDDESWTVRLVSSEKTSENAGKNRKGIVLKLAKK